MLIRASRLRRLTAAVSVPLVLSLALAACGGDDSGDAASSEEPTDGTDTAGAVVLEGQWPLTGEPREDELPQHPVYVVKIENTPEAAPQSGLASADLVVEELVEGGLTRLAAFYYQDVPETVGPVRSMRATDIGIVLPAAATLVASGGATKTVKRVDGAEVRTLTDGASGFYRDDARSAPHNLFLSLSELADEAGSEGEDWEPPARPYFEFGAPDDFTGDIAASKLTAKFSGAHSTKWTYGAHGWTRPGSFAEKGDDFAVDNVLMLEVRVGDAGYLDPAGNPVPETYFSGSGKGVLVHGDKAQRVLWQKKLDTPLTLSSPEGEPVTVPTGHTWVELIPRTTGSITIG